MANEVREIVYPGGGVGVQPRRIAPRAAVGCGDVLIVEDDDDIREALKETLEDEGYLVHTASNGREGLEALQEKGLPCVILLDLMMPVMSGWELLDKLHSQEHLASVPVVVVSASGSKAQHAHVAQVIQKPVSIATLLHTVERFCHHGRR